MPRRARRVSAESAAEHRRITHVGVLLLSFAASIVFAACGDESPAASEQAPPTEIRISLDADGEGGEQAHSSRLTCPSRDDAKACRRLEALPPSAFAPVPEDAVCTLLYGGPQVGRIVGHVEGRRVDATFTRENGCEIARYERVEGLLRLARRVSAAG